MAALKEIGRQRRRAGNGRFKSADFDLAMSGEENSAALGREKFYARTRPRADIRKVVVIDMSTLRAPPRQTSLR